MVYYHAELLDIENNRNVRVVPSILTGDQLVKLQEFAIKHNYVTLIETVETKGEEE